MAILSGPDIVNLGLVLHLDAANRNSYSGSGTTWRDLSGQGNNGTLTNGPTFEQADVGGSISIDSINDYVELGTNSNIRNFCQNNTSFTFDCFVKKTNVINTGSSGPLGFCLFSNNDGGWVQGWSIYIRNLNVSNTNTVVFQIGYNSQRNAILHSSDSYGNVENTWTHIVISHSVINLNSNCAFYKNAQLISSFSSTATNLGPSNNFTNRIGRQTNISWQGHNSAGKISSYKIYNRVLTAAEIRQNFEAHRDRYGI